MSVQTSYSDTYTLAIAGMPADAGPHDIVTFRNADVVSMPFGTPVVFKTSSPTSDLDVVVPYSSGDIVAGIIVFSHDYARSFTAADGTTVGDLDTVGLRPNAILNVMRKGRIWVHPATTTTPSTPLYISYGTGGGTWATAAGLMGNTSDTNTLNLTGIGIWLTTQATPTTGYAVLEITLP